MAENGGEGRAAVTGVADDHGKKNEEGEDGYDLAGGGHGNRGHHGWMEGGVGACGGTMREGRKKKIGRARIMFGLRRDVRGQKCLTRGLARSGRAVGTAGG